MANNDCVIPCEGCGKEIKGNDYRLCEDCEKMTYDELEEIRG